MYLSAIANGSTDVPEPITREEQYLYKIAKNGGGGGGGGTEDYVAEVAFDGSSLTSTVTLSDLQTAYGQGKTLKAKMTTPMGEIWGNLALYASTSVSFLIIVDSAGTITCDSSGWSIN